MKFLNLPAAIVAACVATLLFAAPVALAGPGDPITSVPVGLEGDPGSIIVGPAGTDAKGNVAFGKLAPGRYVVFLPDAARLKVPVRVSFGKAGARPMLSAPILPGKAGKIYALDNNGRRLTVTIDKAGGQIRINVVEAAGPRRAKFHGRYETKQMDVPLDPPTLAPWIQPRAPGIQPRAPEIQPRTR